MKDSSHIFRAYTNIALIKYWGKRNETLFLPVTSSLSLTLNEFYTETQVLWNESSPKDVLLLNGKTQPIDRVQRLIDLFRERTHCSRPVRVESYNHVPTAAGLASSASAFAALACACNDLFDTQMDARELSTYARQGSGSATRSLFGGFVKWEAGQGDVSEASYAHPIDKADWDLGMIAVVLNDQEKSISSREGMALTVRTSPFFKLWPEVVAHDLALIEAAIEQRDFTTLGEVAEHNAMEMHALMLSSKPSYTYFQAESLKIMDCIRQLRQQGIECYFTMDAGPNIKVICRLSQADRIQQLLMQAAGLNKSQLIISGPGPAPHTVPSFTPISH